MYHFLLTGLSSAHSLALMGLPLLPYHDFKNRQSNTSVLIPPDILSLTPHTLFYEDSNNTKVLKVKVKCFILIYQSFFLEVISSLACDFPVCSMLTHSENI